MLRRPTAVKLVLPHLVNGDMIDRFEREVQLMSQLTHPNTVAVFDYGRSPEGIFYYAMEYLDGIDLEKLVDRYGAQPADRVIGILLQVCGALREAHGRGLIHRDIKPANIILCERGDVPDVAKVVDFGLVKEIAAKDGGKTRSILGTPAYIAPESVTDPDQVSAAADLYALGAVAYFLLTGKRVFDGKTSVDLCVQHVTAAPVPPSQLVAGIPSTLEALILRCLAKQPKDRPASATELADLLRAVPTSRTWNDEAAVEWWDTFERERAQDEAAATQRTITIDLVQRSVDLEKLRSTHAP
jgi:serine/threonine-protein kinase